MSMQSKRGLTLVELMIALALIGIGILASVETFKGISRSIQVSKTRTLAANIGQEKMQIVMQKSYYEVLVTTDPAYRTDFTPNIPYDPSYFPPETVVEGGVSFTRLTYVQVVQENSGVIQILPPTTPDTGIRQITVTVVWTSDSGPKSLVLQSVLNNPSTVMSNVNLHGTVLNANTGTAIPAALVNAAENIGWRDSSDATGAYSINLVLGTFNFQASAPGYFTQIVPLSIGAGGVTQNFSLVPMSTGTVQGTAWLNSHLLISQVVGSSLTSGGYRQAFVELYNPTTFYINIAAAGVPSVVLKWQMRGDASPTTWPLNYTVPNSTVPPHGYYLIANTTTITMGGVSRNADARFDSSVPNYPYPIRIATDPGADAASLGIATNPGGIWIDQVGWTHNGLAPSNYPPFYEVTPILNAGPGIVTGEQFVRRCSTAGVASTPIGRAYNDANNSWDFIPFNPALSLYPPRNSGDIAVPIAGTPAPGAIVSVIDGLSVPSSATLVGGPPYAQFSVPGVATGTWVVFIDSGSFSAEIDTVTVVGLSTTSVPNNTSVPAWASAGFSSTVLSTSGVTGMINGKVMTVLNTALSGIIVTAGGATSTTGTNGTYYLRVTTGTYDVIANPGNANGSYSIGSSLGIIVGNAGDVTQNVNFSLPQGGKINGWVSRDGNNPLPGIAVSALDANGASRDTEVSGTDGQFLLINLTTGTYTVKPALDSKEVSSPASISATVIVGFTTPVGTFTVTGALGSVTGQVTSGGAPIKSGVLIVVSTGSIAIPLPALSTNTLTSSAFYSDSSNESGTYSVDVRGSTTSLYNVSAFYMTVNGQTPSISTKTVTGVTVNAGLTTSGVNFAW